MLSRLKIPRDSLEKEDISASSSILKGSWRNLDDNEEGIEEDISSEEIFYR